MILNRRLINNIYSFKFNSVARMATIAASPKFKKNRQLQEINPIKAVVFDLDGTLIHPITQYLRQMREELQVPKGVDILTHVASLPPDEQRDAEATILRIEEVSQQQMKLNPGFDTLMEYLTANNIPKAILTRNNFRTVDKFLTKTHHQFDPVVTREFKPTKPSPAPLLHICDELQIDPKHVIMVGDHLDDISCGRDAGCATVLLNDAVNSHFKEHSHYDVDSLDVIIDVLKYHDQSE